MGRILQGDVTENLRALPAESVDCVITSPPYWSLRDYSVEGQIGLEKTPEEYVQKIVEVFREVRRVLKKKGTLWLNLGDSYAAGKCGRSDEDEESLRRRYADFGTGRPKKGRGGANGQSRPVPFGLKPKDLVGIPWRVAFALQADGWYLRCDVVWSKPNPMPESVDSRPTKSHEYVFLLSRSERYFYDSKEAREESRSETSAQRYKYAFSGAPDGLKEPEGGERLRPEGMREFDGKRNYRSVWDIATQTFSGAHFATYPEELVRRCLLAGCPKGGVVLDPFFGSGTTGVVAVKHQRDFIGIELNPEYVKMAAHRLAKWITSTDEDDPELAGLSLKWRRLKIAMRLAGEG